MPALPTGRGPQNVMQATSWGEKLLPGRRNYTRVREG